MIRWINFSVYWISYCFFLGFYLFSIQPQKMEIKYGTRAWILAKQYRFIAIVFEFINVISIILWIIIPVPQFNWQIQTPNIIPRVIGICIILICLPLLIKGLKDAGKETLNPSSETRLFSGIYRYIRHPQTIGEFPLFLALGLFSNSWMITCASIGILVGYIPLMVKVEEDDLIRRFGKTYLEYKKNTRAIFPKMKKRN